MNYSKEFKIGLLAVVSLLILYFGFNFLKGQDFLSPTNSYYVFYKNVNGLTSSNQVLIDGYNVGMVGDMEIFQEKGTKILVELKIKKNVQLGKDAVAVLMDTDILGGKAISVLPGNLAIPAEEEDTLEGMVQKSLAEEFADRAMPVVQSFDSTILGINDFFMDYGSLSQRLGKAIDNFNALTYNLNRTTIENREALKMSLQNVQEITSELKVSVAQFSELGEKMNSVADSLDPEEIASTMRNLNENLESLKVVTQRLADGEGTLGKLSAEDTLYQNLNSTIISLDSLLIDLKANPKRYVRLSLF